MTLHSSGNSSSQVPLKENGRFTKCFSLHFHHIFSLVPCKSVVDLLINTFQFPAKDFRPCLTLESKESFCFQHFDDVKGPVM